MQLFYCKPSAGVLVVLLLVVLLLGCAAPGAAQVAPPTATSAPATTTPTAPATPVPPTATPVPPTATPVPPTATPTAEPTPTVTPTPDPVGALTIPALRERPRGEGAITIGDFWLQGANYTSYRITYPADGLQLTGLIHIPNGEPPFPVIIANRGYIAPERYVPGMDSRDFSDLMANNGYLVVAPDYRGYGGGDDGANPFYTGYYMDVISLLPLVQQLPQAQPGKVGMWGHSRGASITVAALTLVPDEIAAAVVYAPAPADLAADYTRRFINSGGNPGTDTWLFPPEADPAAYERVSPINYFDVVQAPVMLHHGTADTVVAASASVAIAEALQAAGKDVTLYLYEGGGHTLYGSDDQLYRTRTLEFFQQHLPTSP